MKTSTRLLAAALLMMPVANATILVQELFDGIGADISINGQAATASSIGLTGTWTRNGSTDSIFTANNFNSGPTLPGLAPSNGIQGGVWNSGGAYNTGTWATISLTSAISHNTLQTIYFSFHQANGGDTAAGVGLATGNTAAAQFIGTGTTWNVATADTIAAGNSLTTSYGTLGSNVYTFHNTSGAGTINGQALIVGKISIATNGTASVQSTFYQAGETITNNPDALTWKTSGSMTATGDYTKLLVWLNGGGGGELDAIRLGTTWQDVTGVTAVPEPSTYGLMGASALATAAFIRRRRRRSPL